MVENFEEHLENTQRLKALEDSVKDLEDRIFSLENKFAPMYNIDVDSFFRQFLLMKMNIICVRACKDLMERSEAIEIPPVPPPFRSPDPLGYYKKKSEKDMLANAGTHLMGSYAITKGELKNCDNPLKIVYDWYAKETKYFEERNILGIFEETADEKFPITPIEGQT